MTTTPVAIALDKIEENIPHKVMLGEDEPVILIRDRDTVRAFGARCTHVGAPLERGTVCDGRLVCPWHKAMFDVTDGAVLDAPALAPLPRYAVRVENRIVHLDGTRLASASGAAPRRVEAAIGTVALVGTGAASAAALSVLAERHFAGRVLLIGPEAETPSYDRTALSKMVISGQQPASSTPLVLPDEAARLAIERIADAVVSLDAGTRTLRLASGRTLSYDRALLATGGTPSVPDIAGRELDGVHTLRSAADAARLVATIDRARRAVVIGGSFIGLEVATGLRARGIETTVVARSAVPFERQFGRAIGLRLKRLHEEGGVRFRTGSPARIEGGDVAERVVLADGAILPADLVLLATGIRPETGFVSGVRVEEGGVVVDGGCLAADGLWAAGDIARFPWRDGLIRVEHWRVASELGRIAARNMLGEDAGYDSVPLFWTAHHGTRIDYLGHATAWDDIVVDGDLEALRFVAYLVRLGRVDAAVAAGRDEATMRLAHAMRRSLTLEEARAAVSA